MASERAPLPSEGTPLQELVSILASEGIQASIIGSDADFDSIQSDSPPDLVLLDTSSASPPDLRHLVKRCALLKLPALLLLPENRLSDLEAGLGIDDFVVCPTSTAELVARARLVLRRSASSDADAIRIGGLVINPASYEVSMRGMRVNLRFKEYELLRLLAANPGRVYTREALLSTIWGYDYFGGTRTVDVHIRRLRSKIEDADHSFIETIWNVGYRFREQTQSSP